MQIFLLIRFGLFKGKILSAKVIIQNTRVQEITGSLKHSEVGNVAEKHAETAANNANCANNANANFNY